MALKDLEPYIPPPLPLKNLDSSKLLAPLDAAREALAHFEPPSPKQTLLHKEALASFGPHKKQERPVKSDQHIRQLCAGYTFAATWAKTKQLNAPFFLGLKKIIKNDTDGFRKIQGWIGPAGHPIEAAYYLPPPPQKVPALMQNLSCYLANTKEEPLTQLAISFAQLLLIHPFLDGNGRVARALIPTFLWKRKLIAQPFFFMSAYFEKNRLAYFRKLYDISNDNAWEEWIIFFLEGIHFSSTKGTRSRE